MLKVCKRVLEIVKKKEFVVVGIEGNISESELVASKVGPGRQLLVENRKVSGELGAKLGNLGAIGRLTKVHLELELSDDVIDRTIIRLVHREPLLDESALTKIDRVEIGSTMLVRQVSDNSSRFIQLKVSIDENGNHAKRMELSKIGSRFDGRNINHFELIFLTQFFEYSGDGATAG